jgi:hypothetical protein
LAFHFDNGKRTLKLAVNRFHFQGLQTEEGVSVKGQDILYAMGYYFRLDPTSDLTLLSLFNRDEREVIEMGLRDYQGDTNDS